MRHKLALFLGMALMVTACDKKPEGQTVAIVNGEEITAPELNAALANANLPPNLDKKEARAQVLQSLIDRHLLAQQARKDGIDKSPEFLNRQRQLTQDLLISMLRDRQSNLQQLPSDQEISQFEASRPEIFAKREQWDLAQLRFPIPKDPALKGKMADTKSLDALAALLTANGITFTRGHSRLDTAVVPHDIYQKVVTLDQGEPFIVPVGDQEIASAIVSREAQPISGDQARTIAVATMRKDQSTALLKDRLAALKKSAEIEYQPGYAPK